jgi:sporulation protein YlmC with PRC-barrel domain
MKKMIATALISTFMVGSALAQANAPANQATDTVTTGAATSSSAIVTTIPHMTADQMASSKIVGKSVYNTNNEKIGEVNDLIVDSTGKVAGVVVGVGGFLGMGERNVALTYSSVKFTKDSKGNDRITVAATKDQLKALAPYDATKTNG